MATKAKAKQAPTPALADLLARRNAALERQGDSQSKSLGEMTAAERREADRLSREFNEADRAIVEILKGLPCPVDLDGVRLHLTADRLNFLEVDPRTRRVRYGDKHLQSLLYRYPEAKGLGRRNAPEVMP